MYKETEHIFILNKIFVDGQNSSSIPLYKMAWSWCAGQNKFSKFLPKGEVKSK